MVKDVKKNNQHAFFQERGDVPCAVSCADVPAPLCSTLGTIHTCPLRPPGHLRLQWSPRPHSQLLRIPTSSTCTKRKEGRRETNTEEQGPEGRKVALFPPRTHFSASSSTWFCGQRPRSVAKQPRATSAAADLPFPQGYEHRLLQPHEHLEGSVHVSIRKIFSCICDYDAVWVGRVDLIKFGADFCKDRKREKGQGDMATSRRLPGHLCATSAWPFPRCHGRQVRKGCWPHFIDGGIPAPHS